MELKENVGRRPGWGKANTGQCIRSDFTVMDETIATVNTSRQGSMQLSSPPQCSFDPARTTQEEFQSNWGSPTWQLGLTLRGWLLSWFGRLSGASLEWSMKVNHYDPPVLPHTSLSQFFSTHHWYRYHCWCHLLNCFLSASKSPLFCDAVAGTALSPSQLVPY